MLKQLIEDIDSIRALRLFNTSQALKSMSELGLEGGTWESLREALRKIALMPTQDPRFPKLRKVDRVSDALFVVSFAVMTSALLFLLLGYGPVLSYSALLISLITLNISYLMKFYVSMGLRSIYLSRLEEIRGMDGLFKKAADALIARLRGELKKAGIDSRQVALTLYNSDYAGIVVLKEKRGSVKAALKS